MERQQVYARAFSRNPFGGKISFQPIHNGVLTYEEGANQLLEKLINQSFANRDESILWEQDNVQNGLFGSSNFEIMGLNVLDGGIAELSTYRDDSVATFDSWVQKFQHFLNYVTAGWTEAQGLA